jgi:hypothetical protein
MATTEELLSEILEALQDGNEASLESNRLSIRFGDQLAKIAQIPGNVQQPFAFMSIMFDNINQQKQIYNQVQKAALALGSSEKALRANSMVERARQDFGPTIALNTAIDALSTGTLGLSRETFQLALEMRATGENSRSLLQLQKDLLSQGGLSVSQMNSLSLELKNARDQYGISTDYLVDSINILADKMTQFNMMGVTKELASLTTEFTAKYGMGNQKLLESVINSLFTGDKLRQFAQFGVTGEMAGLQAAPSLGGLEQVIARMAMTSENLFQQFIRQGDLPSVAYARVEKVLGMNIGVLKAFSELKAQAPQSINADKTAEEIKKQEAIQKEIGLHMFEMNGKLAQMLAKMEGQVYYFVISAATAYNSLNTLSAINNRIHNLTNALASGTSTKPALTLQERMIASNAKVAGSNSMKIVGTLAGLGTAFTAGFAAFDELKKVMDDDAATQADALKLILSSSLSLLGALAPLASLFPVIGTILPFMTGLATFLFANPIGLALLAVGAGLTYLATATEDSAKKSTQVQPVRIVQAPSPTVTTNTFLSTNSDLTKALLSNVFDSSTKQRDLDQQQLKALKQQNALQQQTLDFMRRLVTNTKGYSLSQVGNIGP